MAFTIAHMLGTGVKNRVRQIGVELEGGWDRRNRRDWDRSGSAIVRDGSIHHIDDLVFIVGELPSPPLPPAQLPAWLKTWYPDTHNETCGLHVHMSFGSALVYQKLMTSEFMDTVADELAIWAETQKLPPDHPLWPRLRGESAFCQKKFFADKQAAKTRKEYEREADGCRYTMINYAWSRTRTVECRLLPMMADSALALAAIEHLLDITNCSLKLLLEQTEEQVNAAFDAQTEPPLQESLISCV